MRDREHVSAEEAKCLDEQASKRSLDRAKSEAWRTVKVLQDKGLDCLLIVQDNKSNTCQVGGNATMVENCLSLPSRSTIKCSTVNIHNLMNVGRGRRHKRVNRGGGGGGLICPLCRKKMHQHRSCPQLRCQEMWQTERLQDLTPEKALPMQRASPVKSRRLLALPFLKAENPGRRGRGRGAKK